LTHPADLAAEALLAQFARLRLTPIDALQAITERIARQNAGINAFALLDPRALEAAGQSTQRWRAGRPIGLLDGVPCTVKDLIDQAGLPTRRGSRTTDEAPAGDDAPIVVSLKAAGAVIIGKTTTTEFGW
jgi:aspartyl-tRNA(Asn)/glutamyl-tRNA(Gln) amidotransferase subunit A